MKSFSEEAKSGAATLEVFDLRKSFISPTGERLPVLQGVSFTAAEGETIAVTGVSGSGKSTLLHLLGGLEAPDHGVIKLDGVDISGMSAKASAAYRQRCITLVFQSHNLLLDLSAVENVALPLWIARESKAVALQKARELLQQIGLEERADFSVAHLSGGEQQRVAIARALIGNPKLLLADEPTGNLDASMSEEIATILVNQARLRGTITLIATHSDRLASGCNRVMTIQDGRLQAF